MRKWGRGRRGGEISGYNHKNKNKREVEVQCESGEKKEEEHSAQRISL